MGLIRAIVFGTLITIVSFVLSFLFLHIGTTIWYHQTGFQFLEDVDQGRSAVQQQAAITNPGSWQDVLLRDKVYYFILTLIVFGVWATNINHQYNLEVNQ